LELGHIFSWFKLDGLVFAGKGFFVLSGFLVWADALQQIAKKAIDAMRFFMFGLIRFYKKRGCFTISM
jgi:peptidoglycan/LPS O-acetylase OafA/YrhL